MLGLRNCKKCRLSEYRKNIVIGRGALTAPLMIIGTGPGKQEDLGGLPFIGRAGQLLDIILKEIGFNNVYITNIVQCLLPNDREPLPDEIEACLPNLIRKIEIIKPIAIATLGKIASNVILNNKLPITEIRGKEFEKYFDFGKVMVIPTFHPAAALRNWSKRKFIKLDLGKAKSLTLKLLLEIENKGKISSSEQRNWTET